MTAGALLEIERLSVSFGGARVVDSVSLAIDAGEKFALVGESGSGKTVTALAVLGLAAGARCEGSIRFGGRDLLALAPPELQRVRGREIAMIFQEPMTAFDPVFTVGRQIGEVLELHESMRPAAARARAIELLASTGIAEPELRVDSFPHQLSGGQRQRAMIAMALACKPRLLIADEPTTALDVTIRQQILELLDRLQRETGVAILFITHDLNLVRRFSHRVGVMERGVLVETGLTASVFAQASHPYTRRLIDSRPRRWVRQVDSHGEPLLRASDVEVRFRRPRAGLHRRPPLRAVAGVSLELSRGETIGVVGESGSGKTTLALALLGLQPIQSGRIELDDLRLDRARGAPLRAARRRIQVVFQDPFSSLSPRMTVEQLVGEGLRVHWPQLDATQRTERVTGVLGEVGLGDPGMLSRYPHEFSGGQRQRIAIARAIALQPEILVLDEPTSALDVTVQQQILEMLGELQKQHQMAYIFISHDLALVRAVSHRIVVMKDGQIVEQGTGDEVFARPRADYVKRLIAASYLGPQ